MDGQRWGLLVFWWYGGESKKQPSSVPLRAPGMNKMVCVKNKEEGCGAMGTAAFVSRAAVMLFVTHGQSDVCWLPSI